VDATDAPAAMMMMDEPPNSASCSSERERECDKRNDEMNTSRIG
jgi:hypothetical protein